MAVWNLDFYQNDEGYSDGDVEQELLEIVKSGNDLDKVISEDSRWEILYHLSPLRQNILNWYPFDAEASLLEVGAGCGALTSLFCEKVKKVTSIELTKIRSEINFERNKKYENLEIISGNFHNINFYEKFDYIILNGVFEYAGSFTKTKSPYQDFLKKIESLLKPDGVILLSIENRLGLKYFNGAPEDHTNQLFLGIDNYKDIEFVKTFSKNELIKLIKSTGYKEIEFYYPMFDYKFPKTILTDNSLSNMDFLSPQNNFSAERLSFFCENAMIETLINEEVYDKFSNSFLVEISLEKKKRSEKVLYAKISNDRKKEFSIITKIIQDNSGKHVIKEGINPKSRLHLKNMLKYQGQISKNIKNVLLEEIPKGIKMEFLKDITFEKYLLELLGKNKILFEEKIKEFIGGLYQDSEVTAEFYSEKFINTFGVQKELTEFHCKEKMNFDMIFSNVFYNDKRKDYTIIDYEWTFDFKIPVEFVVWRCLILLYINNENVKKAYTLEALLLLVGLKYEDVNDLFKEWDEHFMHKYVGIYNLKSYYKSDYQFKGNDFEKIIKEYRETIVTTLYIDTGNGFNQNETVEIEIRKKNDENIIIYNVPYEGKRIKDLRWDPSEGCCEVKNVIITNDQNNDMELKAFNAAFQNGTEDIFLTNDPAYNIVGDYENVKKIIISAKIRLLSETEVSEYTASLLELSKKNEDISTILKNENKDLSIQAESYLKAYEKVISSKAWKVTKPIRKIADKIKK